GDAGDDVGDIRLERRTGGAAGDRVGVDLPLAAGLDPFDLRVVDIGGEAAGVEEALAGLLAALDHQLLLFRAVPVVRGLGVDRRDGLLVSHGIQSFSVERITVPPLDSTPPVPWQIAFFTLLT